MLFWRCLAVGATLLAALSPPSASAAERPASYPSHVAAQLAEDPVYVSDHYAGALDLAQTRAHLHDAVSRLDHPVYVVVLPTVAGGDVLDEGFLAAVHDRLGEDGVYLLAEYRGSDISAVAYGVDVAASEAAREVLPSQEHDTPLTVVVDRFVDSLASGEAAQRLAESRDRWDAGQWSPFGGPSPIERLREALSPDTSYGVRNQAFALGTTLGATATLVVLTVWHRLRRRPARPRGARRR